MVRSALRCAVFAGALLWLAAPASAAIQITGITSSGSGCPNGSIEALLIGNEASVLFASYGVTSAPNNRVRTVACNLTFDLKLERGLTLAVTEITWQGSMVLEPGSMGRFEREMLFAGARRVRRSETFREPFTNFVLTDRIQGVSVSGCRTSTAQVRANSSLSIVGAGAGEVQSADSTTFESFSLAFGLSPCTSSRR